MAEIPQAASQPEHQTLVLTDPPPEKHHLLLWGLCVAAVALVTGGIVFAYWQFGAPAAEVPAIATSQTDRNTYQNMHGYSLKYPSNWTLEECIGGKQVRFFAFATEPDCNSVAPFDVFTIIGPSDDVVIPAVDAQATRTNIGNFPATREKNYQEGIDRVIVDLGNAYFLKIYVDNTNLLSEEVLQSLSISATTTSQIIFVNPNSPLGEEVYTRDSEHVYRNGKILRVDSAGPLYGQEPDTGSFQIVGSTGAYFKDENSVYFSNIHAFVGVTGANPTTFVPVFDDKGIESSDFGKDDKHVYHGSLLAEEVDPTTFVPLSNSKGYYSKDKNHVYYSEQYSMGVIEGADPVTFLPVSGQSTHDAQDKNHKYLLGQIVE